MKNSNRRIKMGMIGGGPGAFIGAIHRTAALMDGEIDLVCGAFSSDAGRSKEAGASLHLPPERAYASYEDMIRAELGRAEGDRMDFVSIVTPNHLHFAPAKLALDNGFHVVCDKPMTFNTAEAKELSRIVKQTGRYFCLTHTYTGYPMIKEARAQVRSGALGAIRKIMVTYPQGWLHERIEQGDSRQASWRTDPSKSGKAGAMGDIGTHAFNLAEYISGEKVESVCANINTVVPGRQLDDDGAVLLRFGNGATGLLVASQVLSGEENNLTIQVYGEKGGLEWRHADPNSLWMRWPDKPAQLLRAGNAYLSAAARHNSRTPSGHPEGFIEAFANHYRNFALTLRSVLNDETPKDEYLDFPSVEEGIRGMAFIDTVIASGASSNKWEKFTA